MWFNMGTNMDNGTRNKIAVGALQLACTLGLTVLALYLVLAGKLSTSRFGFLFFTALIFGLAVRETRDKWRYSRYWGVLLGCSIVHFGLVRVLQTYLRELPTAILGVLGTIECASLVWILLVACK